jgi:hypothetical protein
MVGARYHVAVANDVLLISDIDSVLCQTAPLALRWIWDRWGVVVPLSSIRRYDIEYAVQDAMCELGRDLGAAAIDEELTLACWNNPQFYRGLKPRQEIWAALHRWQGRGLPLQLMTRRSRHLRVATLSWMTEHGLEVAGDGALPGWPQLMLSAEKAERCAEVCGSFSRVIFLEDALHHAEAIAEQSSAEVWLVAQPWNVSPQHPRVERLDDATIAARLAQLGGELTS